MSLQSGPSLVMILSEPRFVVHETDARGRGWRKCLSCWGCAHLEVHPVPGYGIDFHCTHEYLVQKHGCNQSITSAHRDDFKGPPIVQDWFCPLLDMRGDHDSSYIREMDCREFQQDQAAAERHQGALAAEAAALQHELDEWEAARACSNS